jgi:hypothetical protein
MPSLGVRSLWANTTSASVIYEWSPNGLKETLTKGIKNWLHLNFDQLAC